MDKPFRVMVFGKTGCDKCKVLNRRIDKLVASDEWQDFEKEYCDVETEDGLLTFCRAQCVNPNRIPAMVVARKDPEGTPVFVENPAPGTPDPVCADSKLYQFMGLQTDYSSAGNGTITPKMIEKVLAEARACG